MRKAPAQEFENIDGFRAWKKFLYYYDFWAPQFGKLLSCYGSCQSIYTAYRWDYDNGWWHQKTAIWGAIYLLWFLGDKMSERSNDRNIAVSEGEYKMRHLSVAFGVGATSRCRAFFIMWNGKKVVVRNWYFSTSKLQFFIKMVRIMIFFILKQLKMALIEKDHPLRLNKSGLPWK